MKIDLINNIEFAGIYYADFPYFSDMYIESADYNGLPMDEDQLDELNHDYQMIYELYTRSL